MRGAQGDRAEARKRTKRKQEDKSWQAEAEIETDSIPSHAWPLFSVCWMPVCLSQVEVLLTLEEACGEEKQRALTPIFVNVRRKKGFMCWSFGSLLQAVTSDMAFHPLSISSPSFHRL